MKKSLFPLLIIPFMLAGCGESQEPSKEIEPTPEPQGHVHTFSADWSCNETGHWHDSTCGHDVKDLLGSHIDENNDEKCDVCGYLMPKPPHVHTFSSEWSTDASQHWHDSTCGHDVKDLLGSHIDENNDEKCDVCGYLMPKPPHVHTFSSEWSMNASQHWHDSTCGHSDQKSALSFHADDDLNFKCDICGFQLPILEPEHNCVDSNEDHYCDECEKKLSDCVDNDKDGFCDICNKELESYETGILIKKVPAKTNYYVGDVFDPTGMVVNVQYSDGKYNSVTDYTYSTEPLKLTDTFITIVYKQFSANVNIKVIEKPAVEEEYTKTIELHGSSFASKFPEGTNFDNQAKFEELLVHIDDQLEYYDLVNKITCVKCATRKVDSDTYFQIGTGSPAKGKFNEGEFNWSCKVKIFKVEIVAFNYSNPYEDYATHQIVHNVDNMGHLILDDLDTSFEIADDAAPITKTIVKEYPEGVQGFNLKATGGRMLVSQMKITWRG